MRLGRHVLLLRPPPIVFLRSESAFNPISVIQFSVEQSVGLDKGTFAKFNHTILSCICESRPPRWANLSDGRTRLADPEFFRQPGRKIFPQTSEQVPREFAIPPGDWRRSEKILRYAIGFSYRASASLFPTISRFYIRYLSRRYSFLITPSPAFVISPREIIINATVINVDDKMNILHARREYF